MILMKKLSSNQVLEIIADIAMEDLPQGFDGDVHVCYNDEDDVEVYLLDKLKDAN